MDLNDDLSMNVHAECDLIGVHVQVLIYSEVSQRYEVLLRKGLLTRLQRSKNESTLVPGATDFHIHCSEDFAAHHIMLSLCLSVEGRQTCIQCTASLAAGLLHVVLDAKVRATLNVKVAKEVDDDDKALPIDSFDVHLVGVTSEHGGAGRHYMFGVPLARVVEAGEIDVEATVLYHVCEWRAIVGRLTLQCKRGKSARCWCVARGM
jgi:hypothetical protein